MAYEPLQPPSSVDSILAAYLMDELRRIAASFVEIETIRLTELNNPPARPREGMIVLADGTNWNPGSGAGFYGYHSGTWNLLG